MTAARCRLCEGPLSGNYRRGTDDVCRRNDCRALLAAERGREAAKRQARRARDRMRAVRARIEAARLDRIARRIDERLARVEREHVAEAIAFRRAPAQQTDLGRCA